MLVLACMDTLLERKFNYMRANVGGRNELTARVQRAMKLLTKKQAEQIVDVVIDSLEAIHVVYQ